MTSYCAYKWKEYRIESTEAADDMRKYLKNDKEFDKILEQWKQSKENK